MTPPTASGPSTKILLRLPLSGTPSNRMGETFLWMAVLGTIPFVCFFIPLTCVSFSLSWNSRIQDPAGNVGRRQDVHLVSRVAAPAIQTPDQHQVDLAAAGDSDVRTTL